jgi:hypothetical protein
MFGSARVRGVSVPGLWRCLDAECTGSKCRTTPCVAPSGLMQRS